VVVEVVGRAAAVAVAATQVVEAEVEAGVEMVVADKVAPLVPCKEAVPLPSRKEVSPGHRREEELPHHLRLRVGSLLHPQSSKAASQVSRRVLSRARTEVAAEEAVVIEVRVEVVATGATVVEVLVEVTAVPGRREEAAVVVIEEGLEVVVATGVEEVVVEAEGEEEKERRCRKTSRFIKARSPRRWGQVECLNHDLSEQEDSFDRYVLLPCLFILGKVS